MREHFLGSVVLKANPTKTGIEAGLKPLPKAPYSQRKIIQFKFVLVNANKLCY
jgi:hypothetical protein